MSDTRSRTAKEKRNRKKVHTQMYNMDGVRHALFEESKAGKNFNNLSKLVVCPENILLAYRNVRGNKGAKTPGTDGLTMQDVDSMTAEEVVETVRAKFNWYNPKPVHEFEGHHINPKYKGGMDEYENLVVLSKSAHLLVRAVDPELIKNLLAILRLNKKQLEKLNEFRAKYGTDMIQA